MRFGLLCFIITLALCFVSNPVHAGDAPGLKLDIEPIKQLFSSREGLVFKFTFRAQSRTKLCVAKDILSQMQVNISRSGTGKLPLQPLVIRDNSQIFQEPMRVYWLNTGQSIALRANLKRYQFNDGEHWTPGEYNVDATFNLCEQTPEENVTDPGKESPIKSSRQGWFMIMI
jgi:hypothetical protein